MSGIGSTRIFDATPLSSLLAADQTATDPISDLNSGVAAANSANTTLNSAEALLYHDLTNISQGWVVGVAETPADRADAATPEQLVRRSPSGQGCRA